MTPMRKLLALLIVIASTPVHCLSNDEHYQQKTKLIQYIVNKVSWPKGSVPKNNFTICVLGEPQDMKTVVKLNGQTIKNRKLLVKPMLSNDNGTECQLIYIAHKNTQEQKKLIQQFAKRPVLLLGDMEHFASLGGSINFAVLQNTIALTLNLESMQKSKLSMASKELDNVIVVPDIKDLQ